MKNSLMVAGIGICIGVLPACSTYIGHKVAADGKLPPSATGIPFHMSRPEYTLDITPNAEDPSKANYALNVSYVPDSTQRYTLALDPGLLSDGTFEMNFGDHGGLGTGNAGITSRAVATLESLVSLAVNLIGASAVKDESGALSNYRKSLLASEVKECAMAPPLHATVGNRINTRIQVLADAGERAKKDGGPGTALRLFHYLNAEEKNCLIAVKSKIDAADAKVLKTLEKDYRKTLKEVESDSTESDNAAKIDALVSGKKYDEFVALSGTLLSRQSTPRTESNSKLKGMLDAARAFLQAALNASPEARIADSFAFMTEGVWRARHLMHVERQLSTRRAELLQVPAPDRPLHPLQTDIAALESEWRASLGEGVLLARIDKLDEFLRDIRITEMQGSKAPRFAADEHIKVREERDRLQAVIAQLRLAVIAGNEVPVPAKEKVQTRTGLPVAFATKSFVNAVNDGVTGGSNDRPAYILVLEPVRESGILAGPPDSAANPATQIRTGASK